LPDSAVAAPTPTSRLELTVVVPTFNERDNVTKLVSKLDSVLAGVVWQVIFVDDNSPDATSAVAKKLGQRDARVRCIRRVGRRGLAGAFTEGALSSQAQFVAVMDAYLQHDENLLPQMLGLLMRQSADLVIGSRYTVGGDAGGLSAARRSISRIATQWARRLTRTAVEDPMSGFFMMRRELLDQIAPALSNEGFKRRSPLQTTIGSSCSICASAFKGYTCPARASVARRRASRASSTLVT